MNCKVTTVNIMGFLVLIWCISKEEIVLPEVKNISESVHASGFIKSMYQHEVFSKSSGIIEEVYVTEERHVKNETLFLN